MSKHEELIKRLKNFPCRTEEDVSDLYAIADAIEALEREIAEVQGQRNASNRRIEEQAREIEGLQAELARARTSAELIREGLRTINEVAP